MNRDQVPVKHPKWSQPVRFWLTNSWHFGIVETIGWKWVTVRYKKTGIWRSHKILKDNINTELAEV